MDFLTIAVGLFALTLIYAFQTLSLRWKNLPPGPTPLPLIGNLHLLGNHPRQSVARLAKIYGPLMRLRLGSINTVVISSAAVAKLVLQKHDLAFSSRSTPNAMHADDQWKYSVIWLPVASRWRSLRKAMNSNIFSGSSLDAYQNLRNRKVEELIAYCRESSRNIIFSRDLIDPNSDSGKEFKELLSNIMTEVGKPNVVDFFPFLARFDSGKLSTSSVV